MHPISSNRRKHHWRLYLATGLILSVSACALDERDVVAVPITDGKLNSDSTSLDPNTPASTNESQNSGNGQPNENAASPGDQVNGNSESTTSSIQIDNATTATDENLGSKDEPEIPRTCSTNNGGCGNAELFLCVENVSTPVSCLLRAVDVVAGTSHNCALLSNATVRCWGDNFNRNLGDGTTITRSTIPLPVANLSGVRSIATGFRHTCAVLSDDTVRCWGENSGGQLGDGTTTTPLAPVAVVGLRGPVQSIALGGSQSCALLEDETIQCWGEDRFNPTQFPRGVASLQVAAGHACALLNSGSVQCWGGNLYGQLGDGATDDSDEPVVVEGLSNVQALSLGLNHTCALLTDATLQCWGENRLGELGNGTGISNLLPQAVVRLAGDVRTVFAGNTFTCALLREGTVQCWGANFATQLAGAIAPESNFPISVPDLSGLQVLSAGTQHACGVAADSTVRCWGENREGQLGNGTRNSIPTFTPDPIFPPVAVLSRTNAP